MSTYEAKRRHYHATCREIQRLVEEYEDMSGEHVTRIWMERSILDGSLMVGLNVAEEGSESAS